jgi:L-2-hydroxyglutarate oxidase
VPASGPEAYERAGEARALLGAILERPLVPKAKLFSSRTFLSLAWEEWRSSGSKKAMCERVKRFIPALSPEMLVSRGLAGVRSSLIDRDGFVPEAVILEDSNSLHVLNYNSPGATGAPVFSAYLVSRLEKEGYLDRFKARPRKKGIWDYEAALVERE